MDTGDLRWYNEPNYAVLFLFFGIYGYGVPLFRQYRLCDAEEVLDR